MLNVAVIGLGVMGYNHVRILNELEEANLVAVSDTNESTLKRVGHIFRVPKSYSDYKEMIENERLDFVIISTPTRLHKEVALECIKKGINVFIEKPISDTPENAQEIINASKDKNVILMVGHIERFNPVVTEIKKFLKGGKLGKVFLVNTVRAGPYPKRLQDVGVLIDLAVHDLDIIRYLVGEIKSLYSQLILIDERAIYAKGLFKIQDNINGSSEFSWVSPKRTRSIQIYGIKGILDGNYHDQSLIFHENGEEIKPTSKDYFKEVLIGGNISEGRVIKYPIKKQEPLRLELLHLIDCIKNNKKPLISPEDAKKSLELALLFLKSGKENKPLKVD